MLFHFCTPLLWKLDLYHHMSAILCKLLNHMIWSKLYSKVNLKPVELAVNSIKKLQNSQILVKWNFGHYIQTFRSHSQFTCKLTWKCNSFTYAHIRLSCSGSYMISLVLYVHYILIFFSVYPLWRKRAQIKSWKIYLE